MFSFSIRSLYIVFNWISAEIIYSQKKFAPTHSQQSRTDVLIKKDGAVWNCQQYKISVDSHSIIFHWQCCVNSTSTSDRSIRWGVLNFQLKLEKKNQGGSLLLKIQIVWPLIKFYIDIRIYENLPKTFRLISRIWDNF